MKRGIHKMLRTIPPSTLRVATSLYTREALTAAPQREKFRCNRRLRGSWWRQRAVSGIITPSNAKERNTMMTIYLGLMALGAAVTALLVTGVWALCR